LLIAGAAGAEEDVLSAGILLLLIGAFAGIGAFGAGAAGVIAVVEDGAIADGIAAGLFALEAAVVAGMVVGPEMLNWLASLAVVASPKPGTFAKS